MRRLIPAALVALALAGCAPATRTSSKADVLIWAYVAKSEVGPYTIHIKAVDTTTGQTLKDEDTPVVGEYGPAALEYDSGHRVQLTVTAATAKPIPTSSYIRLQDGGITKPQKTCGPVVPGLLEFSCSLTTKF